MVEADERLGALSAAVKAFGRLVFGEVEAVLEVTKDMPVPTFDGARRVLKAGVDYLRIASQTDDPVVREAHYRNALFDAARLAVIAFPVTEETRWSVLLNRLPEPFDQRFRSFVRDLHIAAFYRRELPLDVEAEFERQKESVRKFTDDLEAAGERP